MMMMMMIMIIIIIIIITSLLAEGKLELPERKTLQTVLCTDFGNNGEICWLPNLVTK